MDMRSARLQVGMKIIIASITTPTLQLEQQRFSAFHGHGEKLRIESSACDGRYWMFAAAAATRGSPDG